MITLQHAEDISWDTVCAIAYDDVKLSLSSELLQKVSEGRRCFRTLIDAGAPCYGVTTGLGRLVDVDLDDDAKQVLARNILVGRAAGVGPPLSKPVARATLLIKLCNFLSARDGVRPELVSFVVDRLNDDFVPWIPSLGHGMGGDAIAHTHCFQTFVGLGSVLGAQGQRCDAAAELERRGVHPFEPVDKEGLSLLSGIGTSLACAIDTHRRAERWLRLAIMTAAVSMEAMAAPRDSVDPRLQDVIPRPGVRRIIDCLAPFFSGSCIAPHKLQAAVSYRVIPQILGALWDALDQFKHDIVVGLHAFSDNPVMVDATPDDGPALLSFGGFHDQHVINQAEHVAIALAHAAVLGERRLHRLMDPVQTGLVAQLAARPGLDAGLVTTQKAAVDFSARMKMLAQPLSLMTSETSAGQEDYMALIVPVLERVNEQVDLATTVICYELLACVRAIELRELRPGHRVQKIMAQVRTAVPAADCDRSPGPDVEALRALVDAGVFDI